MDRGDSTPRCLSPHKRRHERSLSIRQMERFNVSCKFERRTYLGSFCEVDQAHHARGRRRGRSLARPPSLPSARLSSAGDRRRPRRHCCCSAETDGRAGQLAGGRAGERAHVRGGRAARRRPSSFPQELEFESLAKSIVGSSILNQWYILEPRYGKLMQFTSPNMFPAP